MDKNKVCVVVNVANIEEFSRLLWRKTMIYWMKVKSKQIFHEDANEPEVRLHQQLGESLLIKTKRERPHEWRLHTTWPILHHSDHEGIEHLALVQFCLQKPSNPNWFDLIKTAEIFNRTPWLGSSLPPVLGLMCLTDPIRESLAERLGEEPPLELLHFEESQFLCTYIHKCRHISD